MSRRILVLDDDPVNLDVIKSTLEPFGYEVFATTELSQAVQLAQQTKPDLIMSDLYLPDTSGFDFLMRIRRDAELKKIPFVIITSRSWNKADKESSLALGAAKFIYRPIEPEKLLKELAEVLTPH